MEHRCLLAYAAGIVDGEGYVGIKRSKAYAFQQRRTPGYNARIQVRMTDRAPLDLLAGLFGGTVRPEKAQVIGRRPLFGWTISDAQAESALRAILPYMLVKRKQAKTVLVLRRLQSRGKRHRTKQVGTRPFPNSHGTMRTVATMSFSDQYVEWCDSLWMRCRMMNGLACKS